MLPASPSCCLQEPVPTRHLKVPRPPRHQTLRGRAHHLRADEGPGADVRPYDDDRRVDTELGVDDVDTA